MCHTTMTTFVADIVVLAGSATEPTVAPIVISCIFAVMTLILTYHDRRAAFVFVFVSEQVFYSIALYVSPAAHNRFVAVADLGFIVLFFTACFVAVFDDPNVSA